ncbi:hypothetical protein RYX36_031500, partial [Vicia faba]
MIFGMSIFSECGFVLDKEEDNLGLLGSIGTMIKLKKWVNFFQQPLPYNIQLKKEFYTNLVDSNNRRDEVMVKGLKNTEDHYEEILDKADDVEFDVYMQSLCNLGT